MKSSLALVMVTAGSVLAAPILPVTLWNAGKPVVSDGVYDVGPYTVKIEGRRIPALCIDFQDQSKPGDQWLAYVSELGGDLSHTYHPAQLVEYEEEAYLFTLISKPHADRIDLQHAAWAVTDPEYRPNQAARFWLAQAEENYRSLALESELEQFKIISEVSGLKSPREQEFITLLPAPEPSLMNLIAGLLAIGMSVLGRRRR